MLKIDLSLRSARNAYFANFRHQLTIFFFSGRRRHTRWTGDWSSDVCSSDLTPPSDPAALVSAAPRVAALTRPPEQTSSLAPDRSLVERLGEALKHERVAYLQWKGNWKRTRWMSGEGDIDLLVHRSAEPRFSAVLWALGFRRADPPPASAIAGIESYFGLDPVTGRLIHVHTHYRLVVGGIWRTVYRRPPGGSVC